jgi:hypothetical protein
MKEFLLKRFFLFLLFIFNCLAYTQSEQDAIVNERSEAAAQKITEIKNNTKAAIAKLVSFKNYAHNDLKNAKNKTPDSKI